MTDLEASQRLRDRLMSHELIDIELNNSVINTRKHGDGYVVTYQDGREEKADFIVAAVGVKPNTDLIEGTDVEFKWTIKVNEHQQTTAEDVYAAGDVAESLHVLSKEWIYNAIWPVAIAQGKVAAYNMSGERRTYTGNIPMNSVDFYEMWITSVGDVQASGNGIEALTFQTPRIYQKVLINNGFPIAFMAVGNVDGAGLIRGAIVGKIPWNEFIKKPQAKILPIVSQ
jgi:NADPH-dependent 2,4-dienoyl-CoA reductase/sulfur reductase-like enzyme